MAKRKKTSNEDLPEENKEGLSSSDENFGLPEIEYEPLDRTEAKSEDSTAGYSDSVEEQSEERVEEGQTSEWKPYDAEGTGNSGYTYTPPPPDPVWPKIIIAIVLLLVIGGGVWYFASYAPAKKAEAERVAREVEERNAAERKLAEERRAAEEKRRREEDERNRAEELLSAQPTEGTIEILSERTSRYHVVISSAIDGDLTMDYAKKLSKNGISTKLIPPFGKSKFNRLVIADHDTWAEAQANAESVKGTYGDAVWVIKY